MWFGEKAKQSAATCIWPPETTIQPAHLYTDVGVLTCDSEIAADAAALFNYLTGYSDKIEFNKLLVAPVNLRQRLSELIYREIEHQRRGRRGPLIFQMNSLEDAGMMRLLCEASRAGVRIDLLIRGICCLRPGVPGVSDNIRVVSIVGRFLEHSRILWFRNAGDDEAYVSSADLMPRNLNRCVEVLFPIRSPRLVRRVREEILNRYLNDDTGARHMQSDGSYTPKPRNGRHDSQAWFLAQRPSHDREMKPVLAIASNSPMHPEIARETLRRSAARLAAEIDSLRKRLSSK